MQLLKFSSILTFEQQKLFLESSESNSVTIHPNNEPKNPITNTTNNPTTPPNNELTKFYDQESNVSNNPKNIIIKSDSHKKVRINFIPSY